MAKNADYPVFNGTRPVAWIKQLEIAFAANAVNNAQVKINTAAAHLGDYVDWFANQAAFTHWTDGNDLADRNFKDIFLEHFDGAEEKDQAISQMWKRKQRRGETVGQYANYMERVWNATGVDIPGELKINQFISGLEPSIQGLVRAQNPQSITDAIAAGKRVHTGNSHATYLTQEENDPMVTGLLAQVAELTKKVQELTPGREQPIQQQRFRRERTNQRCTNCGKNGHVAKNCWFGNKGRVQCYNCRGFGHVQADCWAKKRKATPGSGKGMGRP